MKLEDLITDSKERLEIKAILGIACIVAAFGVSIPYMIVNHDVDKGLLIFGTFFGAGLTLLGLKTAEDAKLDANEGQK